MYYHKSSVEIFDDISCYQKIRKLGEGGMGEVFLVKHLKNKKLYAMKIFSSQEKAERERKFMEKMVSFDGIAHLVAWGKSKEKVFLIIDYISGISLMDYQRKKRKISGFKILCWSIDLCKILKQFHQDSPSIIYRDLKPQHLILKKNGKLFLIDFGISAWEGEIVKPYGTKGFASPEQFRLRQPAIKAMDIYSFGKVLEFCLEKCSNEKKLKKLAEKCTKKDRKERFGTFEIIEKRLKKMLFYKIYCVVISTVFFLSGIFLWNHMRQPQEIVKKETTNGSEFDFTKNLIRDYKKQLKDVKHVISFSKLWKELQKIKKEDKEQGELLEEMTWQSIYALDGKQKEEAVFSFGECYLTKCIKAKESFYGYQRVLLYLESERKNAEAAYEKFIKKFPAYEEIYVDYGIYLCRNKKWKKAKKIYQQGVRHTKMQSNKAKKLKEKLGT